MSKKLRAILNHNVFKKRVEQINNFEKNRKFCVHDFQHFLDTARITYIILLENKEYENVFPGKTIDEIKEIVYAAGFLHDLGRVEQYTDGTDHALVSADVAKSILADVGFSDDDINLICTAISEHRNYSETNSLFGQKLYQGDKLSRTCEGCDAFDECKIELEYKQGKKIY